jgi:phosphoribosyl 1,2-cyclic phosphodiesterase
MPAFVKFWGTRGSIPTPSSWTRVYGGNTSCVEVRFDDTVFICDAGSGIRELGKDLLVRNSRPKVLHLLITHTHWDHIQGFPFFTPAYMRDNEIRIYGESAADNSPYRLLSGQMSSDYFPVSFRDLGASVIPDFLENGRKEVGGVTVRSLPLNHPGGCHGYIFEKNGCKIVYATDNELEIRAGEAFPDFNNEGNLRQMPEALIEAIRGADLLIADAQYDEKEYSTKRGWGHSCCYSVTDLGIRAGVKNLALFHHDPESTDEAIDVKIQTCMRRAEKFGGKLTIFAAREGVEMKF